MLTSWHICVHYIYIHVYIQIYIYSMYTIYIYKICKCYPQFQFIVKVQNGYSCVASDHLGRACRFFFFYSILCWLWSFNVWPWSCWGQFLSYLVIFILYPKGEFNFLSCFQSICWNDSVIFVLEFDISQSHQLIYIFILPFRDKSYLVIMNDPFNVLISSFYLHLVENSCFAIIHWGYWPALAG